MYTVVWGKFTVGYFHVKIVCGKIFSSLRVSNENFLTTKYFKVKLFVLLLKNFNHDHHLTYVNMLSEFRTSTDT